MSKNLAELGLSQNVTAEEIYTALINKLTNVDKHLFELYDHKELDSALSRVAMLEEIDKKWRGKPCSVVTLVLRP